jgi:hypothetical protein
MSRSDRSSEEVLDFLIGELNKISQFQWTKVVFDAFDEQGKSVYHTNVVLSLTDDQAILNTQALNQSDREKVVQQLEGYSLLEISHQEARDFAGNLESLNSEGKTITFASSKAQTLAGRLNCPLNFINLSVIEDVGGGSSQCMLGKLF